MIKKLLLYQCKILLLVGSFIVPSYAQEVALFNFKLEDKSPSTVVRQKEKQVVSLQSVLASLGKKYGVSIIYDGDVVLNKQVIVSDVKFQKIEDNLKAILAPHNLDFKKVEQFYLIQPVRKKVSKVEKLHVQPSQSSAETPNRQENNVLPLLSKLSNILLERKDVVVKGVVKDKTDGSPLPGVNVRVEGTNTGTITDSNGQYSVTVPNLTATLVFSFIGYTSEIIQVGNRTSIDVVLVPDIKRLEEVVIVGYGVQKKETVVGAITQMDNKRLVRAGVQDVTNAITGELSGVLTIQNSGQPGNSKAEIIIRGLSSWNGSEPLVMVDGVERDFSDLDPNEIETISVLKDASATAVFGAKGANGVILVTSRRGRIGKPEMEFSGSYGFEKATRLPEHIDSYTTMSALNVARMNGADFQNLLPQEILNEYKNPSSEFNRLRYPDNDWFKLMTNWASPTYTSNLNIRGGTEFVRYFASVGYLHRGSFFKGYDDGGYDDTNYKNDRYNLRINTDFSLTKSTTLSFNIGGILDITNEPRDNMWRQLYSASGSRFAAYYPEWLLQQYPDLDYPDASGIRLSQSLEYTGNPYSVLNRGSFNRLNENTLFSDLSLDQNLDRIIEGLSAKGKVSLNTFSKTNVLNAIYNFPEYQFLFERAVRNDIIEQKIADGTYDPAVDGSISNPWFRSGQGDEVFVQGPLDINVGGLEGGYYRNLYYEFSLNYGRSFGKHNVSGLALFNRTIKREEAAFPFFNEGWVGRATYGFDNKYMVEFNVGYTGSERFAPGKRFGFFPSAAVGWTLSEEDFFKNALPMVSFFKIRYSDGLVGSDNANSRWLYLSTYERDNGGRIFQGRGANLTAQWEEAHKRDIGVEFGLFNDVIRGTIDLFSENRSKMLLEPRSTTFLVGQSFKDLNLGKLKKHGFEVELEYHKQSVGNLDFSIKGMFGYNENRIIFKDDPVNTPQYQKDEGKPLGVQNSGVVLTGNGYYQTVDDIQNYTAPIPKGKIFVGDYKFLDYNADGTINAQDKYPIKGNLYPPITYSLIPEINYKNFTFNIMLQGNHGKYVDYNMIFESEFVKGDPRLRKSQVDYWTPYNQNVNHSTLHYVSGGNVDILSWGGGEADRGYLAKIQNRFWRDASFMRIKRIYAAYQFRSSGLERVLGVSGMNLYVTANNVYTFTKLLEGDPERKDFFTGFYPQVSQYNLGLKFDF